MADAAKVSIVMPVRNAAGTLAVALESVRGQTFTDWELVAVDDGSQDETAGILASAARADPRIRILSQAAFGIAEASGTALASGVMRTLIRLRNPALEGAWAAETGRTPVMAARMPI